MNAIIGSFKSKTIWFGAAAAVLPVLAQPVQDWIATHPSAFSALVGAVIIALRTFTTQSLAEKA